MEYVLGVVAAALLGISLVLQQGAAQQCPPADFLRARLVADLLRQPRWLAGIGTMICGQLLSAWVIGHLILAVSEPLLATNLLVALCLAGPLSGQRLRASEIIGAVVLLAGVTALAVAQSVSAADAIVGRPRYWPYCGAAIAVLVIGLVAVGRRRPGHIRAALIGIGAGLAFGLQDALTRRTVHALGHLHAAADLLTIWPVYGLVAASLVGLFLMQNAFSTAPLHASLPTITATEPVCGMVLGILVFREKVPVSAEMIALQAAGVAVLIAGVTLVARAPALAALRAGHHGPGHLGTGHLGTGHLGKGHPGTVPKPAGPGPARTGPAHGELRWICTRESGPTGLRGRLQGPPTA